MRPGAVRRVEDREAEGRVVREGVSTNRQSAKKNASSMKAPETPSIAFQDIASRTAARPSRSPASPDARWSSRRAVRRADRADGRGPRGNAPRRGRTQRGRGGGGGSSRGGAGGVVADAGAPPFPREAAGRRAASELRLRWGWDQRADAASEARRSVSTSRGPSRDALSPGNGDVASSSVSVCMRSGDASSWRGRGQPARGRGAHRPRRGHRGRRGGEAGDKALSDARVRSPTPPARVAGAITVVLNKPVGWVSNLPGPRARGFRAGHRAKRGERERPTRYSTLCANPRAMTRTEPRGELRAELRGLKLNGAAASTKTRAGYWCSRGRRVGASRHRGNEIPKVYVRLDRPVTDGFQTQQAGVAGGRATAAHEGGAFVGRAEKDALRHAPRGQEPAGRRAAACGWSTSPSEAASWATAGRRGGHDGSGEKACAPRRCGGEVRDERGGGGSRGRDGRFFREYL